METNLCARWENVEDENPDAGRHNRRWGKAIPGNEKEGLFMEVIFKERSSIAESRLKAQCNQIRTK